MRIACTTCNALYDLPPERVRPGQGVRCARCKTVWVPVEQEDAAPEIRPTEAARPLPPPEAPVIAVSESPLDRTPLLPVEVPRPQGSTREPAPVPAAPVASSDGDGTASPSTAARRGRAIGPAVAWAASIVLLGAACVAIIAFRGPIAQLWPPSQRLYAWLGLG